MLATGGGGREKFSRRTIPKLNCTFLTKSFKKNLEILKQKGHL
jgi:hypothetical protein